LELADLAWLGVSPLRGLCASLFDPPRDAARLDALDRVRVASGVRGTQTRALLTLGWLMARLGFRAPVPLAPEPNLRRWRARRPAGGEVELQLETRLGGADHGVVELRLEAGGDTWSLVRDRCIDVRAPDLPERMQPATSHTDAELIVSALGPRGRDPVFRAALAGAVALVEAR
jgi:glucose-6-phosphate dehydrogenase assembly protein OpcA